MTTLRRLLATDISAWRIAGFVISNFLGLAIICAGVQVYSDLRSLWGSDGGVVGTDYMVLNKRVTASTMLGESSSAFTDADIADLQAQPWVREVGRFRSTGYEVSASLSQGGRGMSTMLFFESIPDHFVDVPPSAWHYEPGDMEVPIIIARDYLALYNFGFASSAGLPKVSEQVMSSLPIRLRLMGDNGRSIEMNGRIAGYSDRLNTVLVPESFMQWSNAQLAGGSPAEETTRVIVDVSSPGDVAIAPYLEEHGLETAGDHSTATASYLLKVGAGIVVAIGVVITVLSLFILLLSMSLLLEKNRITIHKLLLLGYPFGAVSAPFRKVIIIATGVSYVIAIGAVLLLRGRYLPVLDALGCPAASIWRGIGAGLAVSLLTAAVNLASLRRKIRSSWRL